jgi:hypothetical protein
MFFSSGIFIRLPFSPIFTIAKEHSFPMHSTASSGFFFVYSNASFSFKKEISMREIIFFI